MTSRRRVLAAAAGSLCPTIAGCSFVGGDGEPETTTVPDRPSLAPHQLCLRNGTDEMQSVSVRLEGEESSVLLGPLPLPPGESRVRTKVVSQGGVYDTTVTFRDSEIATDWRITAAAGPSTLTVTVRTGGFEVGVREGLECPPPPTGSPTPETTHSVSSLDWSGPSRYSSTSASRR